MFAMGLFSNPALSQQQSSDTAATQAIIVMPISIANSSDLSFGRLANLPGTVSIAPESGARTSTNNSNLINSVDANDASGRASFTVTGEPGMVYDISATDLTVTLSNAAINKLDVSLTGVYVLSLGETGMPATATSGTLSGSGTGTDTLGIGGSLTLEDDTPTGTYTNSAGISLTVNYN